MSLLRSSRFPASRGSVLVEAIIGLPVMLALVFGIIELGHAVDTRLVLAAVSREGASIGSRQQPLQPGIANLIARAAEPVDLTSADALVVVSRIQSGESAEEPDPFIAAQYTCGGLSVTTETSQPAFGLTSGIHEHLVFNPTHGVADMPGLTIVEVWLRYPPITPLPHFLPGIFDRGEGGYLMHSRAVF
jgi:hypothetical protein